MDTLDSSVIQFRKYFDLKNGILSSNPSIDFLPLDFGNGISLNLRPFSFAKMYNICLEYPEWFDIFIAPTVPKSSDSMISVTCEFVVQIRSYILWMYGVHDAFEKSYEYVNAIANCFDLHIAFCQENRIDYCWHSNYLSNPEQFFSLENFYKMRVDRLTPKVNLVMNVEYQTRRRHSKSYVLLPLRDNTSRDTAKRIYDYLDNRKLIMDYLTFYVFRLVSPSGDINKSRRDLCGFWKALRSCKLIDVHIPPKHLNLVREYSRKFRRIIRNTGIARIHPHLLRHTFATSYILGGGNLETLRILMGHFDYSVTRQYLHLASQYQILGADIYRLDPIFFRTGY